MPATPEQLARNAHIAAALRAAMKHRGWDMGQLNEAMGMARGNPGAYHWANGTGAPGPENRAKLVKVLGLTEAQVTPREPRGRGKTAIAEPLALPAPGDIAAPVAMKPAHDVLTFVVTSEGDIRLKLDVTLPREQGSALLRMILDAGVVFSEA